ncbi:hypothetical protein D3C72_86750 [compost metagenome]
MTGNPASVSVLALAGCLVCPGILSAQDELRAQQVQWPGQSEDSASRHVISFPSSEKLLDFDLPPQALTAALDQYAIVVGRPVVVRDALVQGRTSSAVRGRYTAEAALRILLLHTGLMAESVGTHTPDAFVLKPVPTNTAGSGQAGLDRSYDGLLQARVWEALCSDARTSPGNYRSILRFFVDQSGRVRKSRLVVGSGNAQRDAAILAVMSGVRLEAAPPADLAQPITLILLPGSVLAGPSCDSVH